MRGERRKRKRDPYEFWAYCVCGAIVGVGAGFLLGWEFADHLILPFMLGGAVVGGTLSTLYGDRFWNAISSWFPWWT